MSKKQVQKLMEKLEDALLDVEIDLDSAIDERNDYEFQLSEKTEELELMEEELRLLCQLIYDSNVALPRDGHFTDINPYVSPNDPFKGEYGYG
jgi:hypothetical protein